MKKINFVFVLICVIFWSINSTAAQTAKCDYSQNYHESVGYKTTKASYYKCDLDTKQANYNDILTKIEGQHETRKTDADVKWIKNIIGRKLKIFSSIFCQKFPNLEVIEQLNANLASIDEDSFSNCQNLKFLRFQDEDGSIRELPENLLVRNLKLTDFWIDHNQLTTLPKNLFTKQKELETLSLSDNEINFLPNSIFSSLVKLEVLYLENNQLESINPDWFANLQNLKWLSMRKNQITAIPSKCFASLRNLEALWLELNKIKSLSSNSFDGLQNLRLLNLYGNQIFEVPSKCFTSLGNLEELQLYNNKIKVLKSDSFDGLQNLETLSLRDNEISDLPVGVFIPLNNLQELYLENNLLTVIHSDSFSIHSQLTSVWFQNNKINAIDQKFIKNSAVSIINLIRNVCSQQIAVTRSEVELKFKKCFDNYQPRRQPQPQVSKPIFPFPHQLSTSSQNVCGKSTAGLGNVVGGSYVTRGNYPWIAALVLQPDDKFFCGGTLISNRKVLTAAHCIQDKHTTKAKSEGEFLVLLGVYDLNRNNEVGRTPYAIETVNVHPKWNTLSEPYDYDITVLVLDTEVIFTKYIQPICMPNSNIVTIKVGIAVGFGVSEDETKVHENIPKMLETPIHENVDCFLKYHLLATLSSRRTFCGGTGTGIGVCRGDSGSGLIVNNRNVYYIRGIVSSSLIGGRYGCDVDTYSVFTDVTMYVDWINGISTSRF